ncbi:MAG: site-specific integrase [Polyangiales bacterium]
MTDSLTKRPGLPQLAASAASYGRQVVCEATRKRWAADWVKFQKWCDEYGLQSMPADPGTVALFLAALADGNVKTEWIARHGEHREHQKPLKVCTIEHTYGSIIQAHKANGHDWPQAHPGIVRVMKGIRRRYGTKKKRAAPLLIADLKRCLASLRERRYDDLVVVRNRCILALGWWGAFRRGEIVTLNVSDIEFVPEGMIVHLRRSKMDQEGAGFDKAIPFCADASCCAVKLTEEWLRRSELKSGPLFRRIDPRSDAIGDKAMWPHVIRSLVKEVAEAAGVDPERLSGHSLRAGFITSAAQAGKSLDDIMRHSGHKDERVARSYIRHGTLFQNNAADGLGDEKEPK